MARRRNADAVPDPPPRFANPISGYTIVSGHRSVYAKYAGQRWADVLRAAEDGKDGLVVNDAFWQSKPDTWTLRELDDPRSVLHGSASLLQQNW